MLSAVEAVLYTFTAMLRTDEGQEMESARGSNLQFRSGTTTSRYVINSNKCPLTCGVRPYIYTCAVLFASAYVLTVHPAEKGKYNS